MKTKKKSKPSKKVSENQLQALAEKALTDFKQASLVRFQQAAKVYDAQDPATKDALDRMIDVLIQVARRRMWVAPSRGSEHRAVVQLPEEVIRQNATYMAVEIMKDLALMDVRVEGYKFPDGMCGVCHRPLKTKKKVKS